MRNQIGFSFIAAGLLAPATFANTGDLDSVHVPAAAGQEVSVTYKPGGGVTFKSGEDYSITLGGNITVDWYFKALDGVAQDQNTFLVKEARIYLKGKLYQTGTGFKLMIDGQDGTPTKDAWIKQRLWENEGGSHSLYIRAGQQKQAFGREWYGSSTQRTFISQSIAADTFSGARAGGAQFMLNGKSGEKDNYTVNFGIFNTTVHKGTAVDNEQAANADNELNFLLSAVYDANGMGSAQGDLERSEEMKFSIGAGIYIGNELGTNQTGTTAGVPDANSFAWNLNGAIAMNGIFGMLEIFGATAELDVPGATDESHIGFTIQGDYTTADMFYLGGRFSWVSLDMAGTGGPLLTVNGFGSGLGGEGDQMNISLVGGKYFNGHNNKVQAEVTFESLDFDAAGATDLDNIIFALRYVLRI